MRKILIDVTRLADRMMKGRLPTGVDRVSLAYVAHYAARARAVIRYGSRHLILDEAASQAVFEQLLAPRAHFSWRIILEVTKAWWRLPRRQDDALLFNTGHSGLEDPAYSARLHRFGAHPVFLVHDLIPLNFPEYCRPDEEAKHSERMRSMLKLGKGIIANSNVSLDELTTFAREQNLPMPPVVVASLAPPALPVPSQRPISDPYFVMVSTIEPRKNHTMILHVWRNLVDKFGDDAPRLVVIGRRGWECENVVDLLERCKAVHSHVIELPQCSDGELSTWLKHAQALLFPSFAEGYGLPLVEALALGTPVIASDLPVFREIAGDIPEYLDPLDGLGWAQAIRTYSLDDPAHFIAIRKKIAAFTIPSWPEHFAKVDRFIESLS